MKRPADPEEQALVPVGFLPVCAKCKKTQSTDCPMVFEVKCPANKENHRPYQVRYGFENFEGIGCPACFDEDRKTAEDAAMMEHLKKKVNVKDPPRMFSAVKVKSSMEKNFPIEPKETNKIINTTLDQEAKNESFDKWLQSKKKRDTAQDLDAKTKEDILFAQGYKSESFNNWVGSAKKLSLSEEKKMMDVQGRGSSEAPLDSRKILVAHTDMPVETEAETKVEAGRTGQPGYKLKDPVKEVKEEIAAKETKSVKKTKAVKEGDSDWVWMEDAEDWDFV